MAVLYAMRYIHVEKLLSALNDERCSKAALAPADVISVTILSEEEHSCRVVVPNNQLSLAIGNKGQNARLAAKLTGWKIDINPETEEPVINFDE